MIGNVKEIVLADGTVFSLTERTGEYFLVESEPGVFSMIHQHVFFKDYVKDESLLEILLERENKIKRSEAGRKAAETRRLKAEAKKNNSAKLEEVPAEPIESGDNEDNNTIEPGDTISLNNSTATTIGDESGEFEAQAAKHEEESENDLKSKVPQELKEIAEASPNVEIVSVAKPVEKEVSPEEAFDGPSDEKINEDQNLLEKVTNDVSETQKEAAVQAAPPPFEAENLVWLSQKIGALGFKYSAKGGHLFISCADPEDFIPKMVSFSGADTVSQMNLFPKIMEYYPMAKESDLPSLEFDSALFSGPPAKQFGLVISLMKGMKKGSRIFFVYGKKPKGGLENMPKFDDYNDAILRGGYTVTTEDNDSLAVLCISNE